jgi:tetratricopeptide (TPR) repeat protein
MSAGHVPARALACLALLLWSVVCAPAQAVGGQQSSEQRRAEATEAAKAGAALQEQGTAQSLRQALEKYGEALKIWREVGDRKREATTLNDMGVVHYRLGEYQEAINSYNAAITIYHETASEKNEAITRRNLALIYQYAGDLPNALEQLNAFLDFMRRNNDQTGQAHGLDDIAASTSSSAITRRRRTTTSRRSRSNKRSSTATAELMSRFYRKLLKENKRPAAALREAQIEMLTQTDEPRWHSPYYWAPFVIVGSWK